MILAAILAGNLGIDPDDRWGGSRTVLLMLGLALFAVVLMNQLVDILDRKLLARPKAAGHQQDGSSLERAKSTKPWISFLSSRAVRWVGLSLVFIVVELLYLGLATGVHLAEKTSPKDFYNLLANAFLHGQTNLLIDPPPVLEELAYPWPTSAREGIPVLYDASYFRGKYYLYWGPAPALIAAGWKSIHDTYIGDKSIAFLGISFTFLFSFLSILRVRRRYFPSIPAWLLGCSIILIATVHPMLWVLNPPNIYQAAIASGQAFLLAGVYFALPIWEGNGREMWRYCLIAVLWSFAISSRIVLGGAIGLLVAATVIMALLASKHKIRGKQAVSRVTALVLPLMLSVGILGLYNYTRFGDVLETGSRYQLSKTDLNQLAEEHQLISPGYMPANLIYYLVTPLRFKASFPFIRPYYSPVDAFKSIVMKLNTPEAYVVENATGILSTVPIILLLIPIFWKVIYTGAISLRSKNSEAIYSAEHTRDQVVMRMIGLLLLASVGAMIPFLMYYWVGTRYLLDVIPLLILAAALASLLLFTQNRGYPLRGKITSYLILMFTIAGAAISFLLALSGPDSLFDDLSPVLINWVKALIVK